MKVAAYISLFIYFLAASVYDVKDRKIPIFVSAAAACVLFVIRLYFVCRGEMPVQTAFLGVGIGAALLGVSAHKFCAFNCFAQKSISIKNA